MKSHFHDASMLGTTISLIQIAMMTNGNSFKENQIKIKLLCEFGRRILEKQRSIMGQTPFQTSSIDTQISVIKWVLIVYSNCLSVQRNDYQENKKCIMEKEKEFLQNFLRVMWEKITKFRYKFLVFWLRIVCQLFKLFQDTGAIVHFLLKYIGLMIFSRWWAHTVF